MTPPAALSGLVKRLGVGWTHTITGPCEGHVSAIGLSEETDGDGKRSRVERQVPVTSYGLRATHCATRRAVVAIWVRQKGKRSWTLDRAVRGRHAAEYTPQHLDAGQLTAYVTATSPADYARQLDELANKRAAATAKAAATRAAKRAGTTEARTSVPTEEAA